VPIALLAVLALLATAAACGDDEPEAPTTSAAATTGETTMHVEFDSGSIAPPYNHEVALDVRLAASGAEGTYRLTYRYRDAMDTLPSDSDGDLAWSGTLDGGLTEQVRALAASPGLDGEEPEGVGGSSWRIVVDGGDGAHAVGIPADDTPWRALLCGVDEQARQELGRTGTAQSC
jgi:hypothetical protein